jgi:hypothetical protein
VKITFQSEKPFIEISGDRYPVAAKDVLIGEFLWSHQNDWVHHSLLVKAARTSLRQIKEHVRVCREIFGNYDYDLIASHDGQYRLIKKGK